MKKEIKKDMKITGRIFKWLVLVISTIFFIYPVIYTLSMSFTSKRAQYFLVLWPLEPTITNYIEAIKRSNILSLYKNSIIVTGATVILVLIVSSMAAYAFARKKFFGSNFFFYLIFLALIIPPISVFIPLLVQLKNYHLINTYWALIFPYTTISVPFATFILRNFFKTIPVEIEEAAKIDGCNDFQIFYRITLPLSKSALGAVTIFTALAWWNEYLFASVFITNNKMQTIPAGIGRIIGTYWMDYTLLSAALIIALIPMLIVYLVFQRTFIKGVVAGAIKG